MSNKHKQVCPSCGAVGTRLDRYDAYACRACDVWLERACSDSGCAQCSQRRDLERPSQAPAEVWDDPWNT